MHDLSTTVRNMCQKQLHLHLLQSIRWCDLLSVRKGMRGEVPIFGVLLESGDEEV